MARGVPPRERSSGDEAFADGEADEVGLRLEAEFAQGRGAMGLDGAGTDEELFSDPGVAGALGGGRDEAKGLRGESDEARSARHRGSIVLAIALRTRTCGNS